MKRNGDTDVIIPGHWVAYTVDREWIVVSLNTLGGVCFQITEISGRATFRVLDIIAGCGRAISDFENANTWMYPPLPRAYPQTRARTYRLYSLTLTGNSIGLLLV